MQQLYTIGYTGLNPALILELAVKLDARVMDIRYSPWSKSEMWDYDNLKRAWGVRYYEHCQWLGNVNYSQPERGIHLSDVISGTYHIKGAVERRNVILMCACAEVKSCHRAVVAREMLQRYGVETIHLDRDAIDKLLNPVPDVVQMSLF